MKKGSNPPPPEGVAKPAPPPAPPLTLERRYQLLSAQHVREMEAHEAVLKLINETIYATGAPLGSDNYFAIRKLCCDNINK